MNALTPVLLHGQASGGGLHFWLDQALVVLLIAAVWLASAGIGRRIEQKRRKRDPGPGALASLPGPWRSGSKKDWPIAD